MPSVDIAGWICAWIADALGIDHSSVDPRARPFDLGLASIHGLHLTAALAVHLGRPVSPTLLWQHPTIAGLAAHLAGATPSEPASPASAPVRGPVAIVGLAGRFPKAAELESFWTLLATGVDATGRVPADRWQVDRWHDPDPHSPGKTITDRGAFLDDVRGFEPLFFGISPREADDLDPQQRLALELVWEALEHAGVPPRSLAGSRTGVYLGSMWHDWADLTHSDLAGMSAHRATGTSNNLIANRVSYVLGLRGPSLVLDTACSSALVAIHLACQALADGDAELAIAGAVNLMLTPASTVFCSKFGGLAPDGRCKTFDAAADGFARGEGGGVVVLKPLARALADGDHIHAVIRGSAVNNDGASQGLTAPNPRAQEDVLRAALARAGVAGPDVHHVEAHGTGTLIGDPIEASALGAVFAPGRADDHPLLIGSVKTNIGHLEGAAGIAGIIKTVLAMRHRAVPPSLHLHHPNPHIPFAALRLHVPTALTAWPAPLDAPALAGISAFGWGGTNAHIVLEAAPPEPRWIGVAAHDPDLLDEQLRALATAELEHLPTLTGEGPLRAAFIARSTHELRSQVEAALQHRDHAGLVRGEATPSRLVFVCSPLGSQWLGMARQLLDEPVFRAALGECDRTFAPLLGRSLINDLRGAWTDVDAVVRVQPLLFSVQVGLARLLHSWGIVPAAIVGHSAGEIAAAHIAGALDLAQAASVVHHYARVQRSNAGAGAMAVVALPAAALDEWLAPYASDLVIAAHNSASSTVISGAAPAITTILTALQAAGIGCSPIHTDVAGHSPLVAAGLPDLITSLTPLRPTPPTIALHSSVTGGPCDLPVDGPYWVRNLGGIVRFHEAIADLFAVGHDTFIELGPHPVVSHAIQQIAAQRGVTARILPTLRRANDEHLALLSTRSALFVTGATGPQPAPPAQLLLLSAHSEAALERSRDTLATWLDTRPLVPHDVCFTAAVRRTHLEHRLAVVGTTREALAAALRANATRGHASRPTIVFVFPGQGSQWSGMGRVLLATQPVFRAEFLACTTALAPHLEVSPLDVLTSDDPAWLERSDIVQPVLWAFGVSLARLLRELGVEPNAVVGHSMGEVAAACVSGALSLADGARIIALRSKLACTQPPGRGAMAVVELSLAEAERAIASVTPRVVVGVHNGPRACVLSGEPEPLAEVLATLEHGGVFCRRVRVDYASHSPQMDALTGPLLTALADIEPRTGHTPMLSTRTADWIDGATLDPAYWAANLRDRVRFAEALERLLHAPSSPHILLELSPHPVLLAALRDGLPAGHLPLGSLRRDEDEHACLLETLGALHVHGIDVALARLFPDGGRTVELPPIAWQRTPHWFKPAPTPKLPTTGHPVLGTGFTSPAQPGTHFFAGTLSTDLLPYLADHQVGDAIVVPGATWLDLVLTAAAIAGVPARTITKTRFEAALVLPDSGEAAFQVVLSDLHEAPRFECFARIAESWTRHAHGLLRVDPPARKTIPLPAVTTPSTDFYAALAARGLRYGPRCRGITAITRIDDTAHATLARPPGSTAPGSTLHPVLLDSALHSLLFTTPDDDPRPLVPIALDRMHMHRPPGEHAHAIARLTRRDDHHLEGDIQIHDESGELVTLEGLHLQRLAGTRVTHDDLHTIIWRELPTPTPTPTARTWLLIPDRGGIATQLATRLVAAGDRVELSTATFHDGLIDLSALDATITLDTDGGSAANIVLQTLDPALRRIQALPHTHAPRLFLITRGARQAEPNDPIAPAQAPLWGLGLTLAYEHPELRCTRIDLPISDTDLAASLDALTTELRADTPEDQLAFRGPRRLAARLIPGTVTQAAPVHFNEPGALLITGGLGGLGLALAQWLVERGALHLVLLGRRGITDPSQAATIASLRSAGTRIDIHQADVADASSLQQILDTLDAPLLGVFHAAGVLADGLVRAQDRQTLAQVLAPKIAGAWNLHRLTRDRPLRHFVLYSSIAALIGSPGQSNYAAANAFLDALAEHRHSLGLPALSIAWGAVADIGLAAQDEQRGARLAGRGMLPLTIAHAHTRLGQLLVDPKIPHIGVAPFDPRAWAEFYPSAASSPMFADSSTPTAPPTRIDLASATPDERAHLIKTTLHAEVRRVLRVDTSRLHRHVSLLDLGLDSLTGLELRNRLEATLGLPLRASLAWTYPRLDDLATHLGNLLTPPPDLDAPPIDALTQLSDDELMQALAAELGSPP